MNQGMKVTVFGRVQGVSFRAYTCRKAQALGLKGTVTNLADGSVEVLAFGAQTMLVELLDWLHTGSPFARVEHLEHADIAFEDHSEFKIG